MIELESTPQSDWSTLVRCLDLKDEPFFGVCWDLLSDFILEQRGRAAAGTFWILMQTRLSRRFR